MGDVGAFVLGGVGVGVEDFVTFVLLDHGFEPEDVLDEVDVDERCERRDERTLRSGDWGCEGV